MKLLLSPRLSDDSIRIWEAAASLGWEILRVPGWRTRTIDDVTAIYGEALWARAVASQVGRVLLEPPADWVVRLPYELVRRRMYYGPLNRVTFERKTFVKPPYDKLFPAQVWDRRPPLIDPETPVIASEVVQFLSEKRVWLFNGVPYESTMYRGDLNLEYQRRASDLAAAAADAIPTPLAVVIDVGLMADNELAIIEANPCFGSGIYGADPARVLRVLQEACGTDGPAEFIQRVQVE